jgi:hypothetical protein
MRGARLLEHVFGAIAVSAIGLASLTVCGAYHERVETDGVFESARILPDAGGRIELVVTSVNSARRSALPNAALVGNIVNALPQSARVLIMTNDRSAFTIASNPAPERVEFIELPADNPITIWPQDPFVVLRETDGTHRLHASKDFDRAGDAMMAEEIGEALGWPVSTSAMVFEGGNVIADEKQVFIGENTVRYNAVTSGVADVEVVKALERELGRPVTVIGPSPQPVPHLDMMLTAVGADVLVLADSGWGAEIAARELEANPGSVEGFERNTVNEFFGHTEIRERVTPEGDVIEAPVLAGATARAIEDSRRHAEYFDALARTLQERGFEVRRVPFLQTWTNGDDVESPSERPFRSVLDYPVLTYNNVLVETRADRKFVYLPQYGLDALDRAARERWQTMGYDVIPIRGFTTSALYGGALRCSVKVLSRSGE